VSKVSLLKTRIKSDDTCSDIFLKLVFNIVEVYLNSS
jgi:hypothetical protein